MQLTHKGIFNMETLEERQMTIEIQYIVESLIEQYYAANTESKKYFVQLRFVDFVIDNIKNPLALLGYLQLQEDKFKPFISCLRNVKLTRRRKKRTQVDDMSQQPEPQSLVIYQMRG